MDSSSEDFEDLNCIEEGDLDNLDISEDGPRKPHFLDYDAAPPTGEELQYSCYSSLPESSSRQSLRDNAAANDLDKNNANEKKGSSVAASFTPAAITSNVPLSKGDQEDDQRGSLQNSSNILLNRRRSANELPPPQNTGTRKKEFPVVTTGNSGYHSQQATAIYTHSLDYESVPIKR